MSQAIFHLEKFPHFLERVVELNRLYAPDDELHEAILHAAAEEGGAGAPARKTLTLIHRHFPARPMHEQAAYLVRAFNGLAPFAEANHRTAWDLAAELIQHNDHELTATWDQGRELGNSVWDECQDAGFTADDLEKWNDALDELAHWFKSRIS